MRSKDAFCQTPVVPQYVLFDYQLHDRRVTPGVGFIADYTLYESQKCADVLAQRAVFSFLRECDDLEGLFEEQLAAQPAWRIESGSPSR